MKESFYNVFFPFQGKIIGFNGLSQEFIILERELFDLFKVAVDNRELTNLKDYHLELYDYLYDKSFIAERNKDELNEIIEKERKRTFNDTSYSLHINPTMNCNFKCWYCYESHIKGSKMDTKMVGKVNNLVSNIIDTNKKLKQFLIGWFGGEPLLYFDDVIKPIIKFTSKKCIDNNLKFIASFTTNGLLLNKEKLDFLRKYDVGSFQITLDGDENRHNKVRYISKNKGSYKEIVQNIKLATYMNFNVNVRINYSKETMDGLENIVYDFLDMDKESKQNLRFDFHKVWQEEADLSKEKQQAMTSFKNNGFKVSEALTFDFTCYADKKNNANINYNGDVYKCTARDYTTKSREGVLNDLGVIEWNEKYHERLNSKFKNPPCLKCKILPVCKGGCSQVAIENKNEDYCIYNFNEEKKIEVVRNHFANIFS